MVDVRITVDDGGLEAKLLRKAAIIPSQANSLTSELVDIAYKWVQREAPRKTGRLKSSGIEKNVSGSHGYVFASKARVKYMDWVIDGTRPHDIVPKNRQALSWPGANHPVKRVHHPGTKSNPFVDRASGTMMGEVEAAIRKFESWLEEI